MGIKLSVIICTYNRAEFLVNALASLSNQLIANELFEVVVINNNSNDNTEEISKQFERNNPNINFQYVIEQKQGLSHARNKGIEVAIGEYLSFIDDDAIALPDYAGSIVEAFEKYKDYVAVGGKVIPFYDEGTEIKWLSKYIWGMVAKIDLGDEIKAFNHKYPAGCNMAFRKNVFDTIGNFDIELANRCDDRYIFTQIANNKLPVLYYPKAAVNHYIPNQRVTEEGIIKLSKLNGSEHRKLLRKSKLKLTLKFFDYLVKLGISLVLAFLFLLKGEPAKTKIVKIMYYSLIGFISK